MEKIKFKASSSDFSKIPGSPISYWVSKSTLEAFNNFPIIEENFTTRNGLSSGNNERFIRFLWELDHSKIGMIDDRDIKYSWCLLYKGGDWRKWYGNVIDVIYTNPKSINSLEYSSIIDNNKGYICNLGMHWNRLSAGKFGSRLSNAGILFEDLSPSVFSINASYLEIISLLAFTNSIVFKNTLPLVSSGWKTETGHLKSIPFDISYSKLNSISSTEAIVSFSKSDWDSFETSWDFTSLPLLSANYRGETLADTYSNIRAFWQSQIDEMKRLEEENNRIFIDAYGLNDELTPDVPLKEITITCNPNYRYGDVDNLEGRLLFDTIQEFIHYSVGCMFGRYSLDKDGLVLANQGESLDDYLKQMPNPKFMPDADNILPILSASYFEDDIVTRFNEFLRVTFGKENYEKNLGFIENTLADNGKGKNIRDYFQKHFYEYHVRRFKKRPIYWQFQSPNKSFMVLIYMHRYRPDQVSVILNDYLREYKGKLNAELDQAKHIQINGSDAEKVKAIKGQAELEKIIREIDNWEHETLFPLAQARIEIDLDDGVKTNYPKFGAALAQIKSLADE